MDTKRIITVLTLLFLVFGPVTPVRAAEEELQELEEIQEDQPALANEETTVQTVPDPEEEKAPEAEVEEPAAAVQQEPAEEAPAPPPVVAKKAEKSGTSSSGIQNYKIGIGDLLQIEVYDEDDLTKEVRVLTDGFISFPLLGNMRAAGLTVAGLEKIITAKLAEKYLVNPQVTVFVKEFSSVYVFGEVKKPGSFPIYGNMTVFEAVTLAGGFTEVANPKKVKVIRQEEGHEVSFEVDMERLTKHGDTSGDLELQANDRVIVPRSFF